MATPSFNATRCDSMLDRAKLSLREAERWEAQAEGTERSPLRWMRDELLLANAQALTAIGEALTADKQPDEDACAPEEAAESEEQAEGIKVGTAYIEVRPNFTGFDGEDFVQAVRRVVETHAADVASRRAFRP